MDALSFCDGFTLITLAHCDAVSRGHPRHQLRLFVGSTTGGKAAAIVYTLIETAKLNAVEPHAWLADTLPHIPDTKIIKVDDLHRWGWNG